ncbi:hypothetical protein F4679DRAFT_593008 [Xylaria curta]|nr:hypothetical protein F4679DRAFT_593008 [Xylaria curta]
MLKQIDVTDDASLCKRVLAITSVAFRPLTLEEVRVLDETLQNEIHCVEEMRDVVARCGSFLIVRGHTIYPVHQSATDFLLSKAPRQILPRGIQGEHLSIYSRSLRNMYEILQRDIYGLNDPGILVNQIIKPNPDPLATVRYPCMYWIDHFIDGQEHDDIYCHPDLQDDGRIYEFLSQKYLYWLEALGWLGIVSKGIISVARLGYLPQMGTQLRDLIHDANRFIRYFREAIESAPLQMYASALVFAPEKSIVRNIFHDDMYNWIFSKPKVPQDWDACLQTFEQDYTIKSLSFSPDSKLLASGSYDKVWIWSVATGALQRVLEHSKAGALSMAGCGAIKSVAFSSDSKLLSAASGNSTILIWSVITGELRLHFSHGGLSYVHVAFSPDSVLIASVDDQVIRIWSLATGALRCTLQTNRYIEVIAFSSDSMLLAAISRLDMQVWSVSTGELQRTTMGDSRWDLAVLSPDLQLLALSRKGRIEIRSALTGVSQQTIPISHKAHAVTFSFDSEFLAASTGPAIWIWSVSTGTLQHTFKCSGDCRSLIAFSPDSKLLAWGTEKIVRIWSTAAAAATLSQQNVEESGYYDDPITSVAFSSDIKLLASASANHIRIQSVDTSALHRRFRGNIAVVKSMAFSHDSSLLASGSVHCIQIHSVATGALQQEFQICTSSPGPIHCIHDSNLLARATKQMEQEFQSNSGVTKSVYRQACGCELRCSIDEWRKYLTQSTVLAKKKSHENSCTRIASMVFSPDSTLLASNVEPHDKRCEQHFINDLLS